MSCEDSILLFVNQIREGNERAAAEVWDRYFQDLVRVARQKLAAHRDPAADEEDAAQSALKSFFVAARKGRFPDLRDSQGLWRLLSEMTRRKAINLIRRATSKKRGGGKVQGESAVHGLSDSDPFGLSLVPGQDPTPEFAAIVAESITNLMDRLEPSLQSVVVLKMEGWTNKEIAGILDCSVATIERRLQLIRKRWQRNTHDDQ
jgi:RNA polymerase sigma factor (sigma-70 family)